MLSTLLQGGMPLVPAMETAGASMTSRSILNGVAAAAGRVREGQGLAKSLEEQKIFPDLAVEMIEVGESTGALPAMLNSVAEFYEEDVQTALGAAMALIEPIILIFMAVFVGGVLISLYLPIFTLGCRSALERNWPAAAQWGTGRRQTGRWAVWQWRKRNQSLRRNGGNGGQHGPGECQPPNRSGRRISRAVTAASSWTSTTFSCITNSSRRSRSI